jgi:hypothetical protein
MPAQSFRAFVCRIDTDPDLALGFAEAYRAMDDEQREATLGILQEDVASLGCDPVSVFAPLFAVEENPVRRQTLLSVIGAPMIVNTVAFETEAMDLVLVERLSQNFVSGTRVRFTSSILECDVLPLVRSDALEATLAARLFEIPLRAAIDRIAEALVRLTHGLGQKAPASLLRHAHLFGGAT